MRDINNEECSVGVPCGKGIRIGYAGWGNPDILLDPRLPLSMDVDRLDLNGKFQTVVSKYLLNHIHGDCNLTHAVEGLLKLMNKDGTLKIEFISTGDIAFDASIALSKKDYRKCQILEKVCFAQPVDDSGLIYKQNFINKERIRSLIPSSFNVVTLKSSATSTLSLFPDDVRLDNISDQDWEDAKHINSLSDSLDYDRPRCILCKRPSTKMDHNRKFFSRYCKDHYYDARKINDKMIINYYTTILMIRRDSDES